MIFVHLRIVFMLDQRVFQLFLILQWLLLLLKQPQPVIIQLLPDLLSNFQAANQLRYSSSIVKVAFPLVEFSFARLICQQIRAYPNQFLICLFEIQLLFFCLSKFAYTLSTTPDMMQVSHNCVCLTHVRMTQNFFPHFYECF